MPERTLPFSKPCSGPPALSVYWTVSSQLIQEHPLPTQLRSPEIEPLIQRYIACGIMGLAELWINNEPALSPDRLVALLEALITSLEHVTL